MKEILTEAMSSVEKRAETIESEPIVEILGSVREFSQKKRWFRDRRPIPDIG